MTTTAYHASTTAQLDTTRNDICVADEQHEALGYLAGRPGYLHTIEHDLHATDIADEREIRDAAETIGRDDHASAYIFELLDDSDVRDQLVTDGYSAARFEDLGLDNAYEHDTLRIIVASAYRVTNTTTI